MREPYVPLFTSVVRSSLWSLSGDAIKVFLTLCAEADPEGYVSASIDGIRRLADLPLADVERHISTLEGPDPYSKDLTRGSEKGQGARIERVPNGWRVVNLGWYRELARKEAEKARKRRWWNENRGKDGSSAKLDATLDAPKPKPKPTPKPKDPEKVDPKDLTGSARVDAPMDPPPPGSFEEAMRLPVQERAKLLERDPHLASYYQPEKWPEVLQVAEVWEAKRLGPHNRDSGVKAVVALYASGFAPNELSEAARRIRSSQWAKRATASGSRLGMASMGHEAVRKALEEPAKPEDGMTQAERIEYQIAAAKHKRMREASKGGAQKC